MPILIDVFYLILGLVLLYFGAEWLVGGAGKIAVKYGISPLVVGLTIVAFGTSAPELFVSIGFNMGTPSLPDMSIGNVVGSNICNIGLVLGLSAFICVLHVRRELIVRDMPILALSSLVLMAMLLIGSGVGRIEGILLFTAVVVYTFIQLKIARKIKNPEMVEELEAEFNLSEGKTEPVWKLTGMVFIGLVLLYLGARALEEGGVGLAKLFGVPEAVISLTLIAFSTSVPELAASAVAAMKKEGDIIIGNIIGSCIFNILCVVGATAAIKPMVVTQIELSDLLVMVVMTLVLFPIMLTRKRISRFEGALLLLGYAGYITFLWFDRVATT
ncbi:MAG: calcium/sodium antiporter [Verrucomicrobiales bacterium]